MNMTILNSVALVFSVLLFGCQSSTGQNGASSAEHEGRSEQDMDHSKNPYYSTTETKKLDVPLSEWKEILPAELFRVAFEQGTERPFTGKFEGEHVEGVFRCAVCGNALFSPDTKFESGTGWPSFYEPMSKELVIEHNDGSIGMMRAEVVCSRCDAHLGHVFEDGPQPTGLRYCINAVSLNIGD
ncbi:MAG TPA: peptide-methionine (R)-S-oxide reductase MsrB [Flavobacteriales bacterium]|nr:peptide-methionine (R)-S-oxide reductase MsrB [Flavobacteriales bacterium]HQX37506.1 peptide-methionine (R)-S-oxide reductase MsrB [Flavobacteriales bacterium]HQZ91849.1 peptide-methionine (R)-S-oxide reductase MsrB [Flavobacteriales bacterium]